MWARVMPTMSAWPLATIPSATAGSRIAPVQKTGSRVTGLIAAAKWTKLAGGKYMDGMCSARLIRSESVPALTSTKSS
jgi:hypothetical protein